MDSNRSLVRCLGMVAAFACLALALTACAAGDGAPTQDALSQPSGGGARPAPTPTPRPRAGNIAIPAKRGPRVPRDVPEHMQIAMGGGGDDMEDCVDIDTVAQDRTETVDEVLLPSGEVYWCYCRLAEPDGETVSAALSAPDGSSQPLNAEVFVGFYGDFDGDRCARFIHRFETYPPPGVYTFSVTLSGRTIEDAFDPAVGVLPFDGWQPNEPVRLIVYAYLGDPDGATFVDDVRTQADAEGRLRVDTSSPGEYVRDVLVFATGQKSGCRMIDTMICEYRCGGCGWTYDSDSPIYQDYQACPDAPRAQVRANDKAVVTHQLEYLPVRVAAGLSSDVVGELPAGETVDVVEGPACVDGLVWWNVRSDALGVAGWVVEREDESSELLSPLFSFDAP